MLANVEPKVAIYPPTRPTKKPGLSAILLPINAASIGTIKLNANPPTVLKNAAASVCVPKLPSCGAPAIVSIRKANAMKIPPATTNGNILDTPFIKCL